MQVNFEMNTSNLRQKSISIIEWNELLREPRDIHNTEGTLQGVILLCPACGEPKVAVRRDGEHGARVQLTRSRLSKTLTFSRLQVWRLIAVGSQCSYLKTNNHNLEAVTMRVSDQTEDMRINTLRKMDGICWNIKQDYKKAVTPGRFSRKNRGLTTDIVVGETDYTNYAILFFQQRRKITVKLYGRTSNVDEAVETKFQQLATSNNIPEIFIYAFPQYGFCDAADEFHQLDDDFGKS
ncbi:complement component C8 gamma chain-like [Mobula hypostoma]|uniref:complement component C8 gamma chain-like n=1 Tax=Mobula hypostoma TaxID=723540 RepID=UPI002FC30DBB